MSSFGLKDEVVDFIVDAARLNGMSKVVLFGSRARGNYSEKSDIDLAIAGQGMHGFMESVEDHCPTLLSFDFIDLSKDISRDLQRRIAEEGVVIYGEV